MRELTQEQRDWTMDQLNALIAANNNEDNQGGQTRAAELVGISGSILSGLRNGTYRGRVDEKLAQLYEYFSTKKEAAATYAARSYVATSISGDIEKYLRYCHIKGGVMSLTGDAGVGKTMAIRHYMANHTDTCIRITMRSGYTNQKVILTLIGKELGVSAKGGIQAWCEALTPKLRDGMLLIVDEAQHCTLKQIDLLRSFSDEREEQGQTLGIAFVGNRLTANKFGAAADSELGQISSRSIANRHYSVKDVRRDDILRLFPGVSGDEPCVDFLLALAQDSQGIRGAVRAYTNAADNGDVSYDGIVAAAKLRLGRRISA